MYYIVVVRDYGEHACASALAITHFCISGLFVCAVSLYIALLPDDIELHWIVVPLLRPNDLFVFRSMLLIEIRKLHAQYQLFQGFCVLRK